MAVLKIKKEDDTWEVVSGGAGSDLELDSSLTVEGAAADAKAVGDKINTLETIACVNENNDGNITFVYVSKN